ncbi:hypothetical protein EN850_02870 [Mesorhizobium sp. M8A.F.Ca.ET.207.01.1.1]|uniref:hypothetical protein n=1 Tax=Mesorhizobium sp. M8A.F.Ca.ET.207.01.1.1 TaxID=2563968 RepID=UPI00109C57FD|nr:hypothetical protein [Mesorhizobium sp. M8A.F.Ca.ET.207.01.1.1]TGQ83702.1 hypothetical protein EN850_02870 [Mesorhizobium sp. M8A.F.Ca.ET.207.01.1.1]
MAKWERNRIRPSDGPLLPSMPAAVQPALRFMLGAEARAEAEAFRLELNDRIQWSNIPGHLMVAFVEKHLVGQLADRWPQVARADEAVGGLLTEVLRAFAANPKLPGWWKSPAVALASGRPERLRETCEGVLAHAGVPLPQYESYKEEVEDHILKAAVRHWQDRDRPEFEGDDA